MTKEEFYEVCVALSKGEVTLEAAKALAKDYIRLMFSEVVCTTEQEEYYNKLWELVK